MRERPASTREESAAPAAGGRLVGPVLVLRLRGTQEEMGAQHGRLLRERGGFAEAVAFYADMPRRLLFGRTGGAADLALGALARPIFGLLLGRLERGRPPAYAARTRAFLESLGVPGARPRDIFVMDLFQNLIGVAGRLGLGPFAHGAAAAATPACSTLAVWGAASEDGALRHARNFDFPGIGIWDRAPIVALCEPAEGLRYGFVATRGADTPGVTAFNEAGITISAHTRLHRDVCFSGAGIVDLGHEIVRRAESLRDAVAIARERRVASTWGIAVSSARERRAITIETTAARVEVVAPAPGEELLSCTNHYRHEATRPGELWPSPGWPVHSGARARRLESAARAAVRAGRGLGAEDLERLLGDHGDPEEDGAERAGGSVVSQPATVQSVVVEPEARAVRVGAGTCPAGWGPYARIPWDFEGEVGASEAWPAQGGAGPAHRFASGRAAEAYARFLEAARVGMTGGDHERVRAAIGAAAALDPDEPRYRFLAGLAELRAGERRAALAHLERAAALESAGGFRAGNALLWASRAADAAGERERARALRAQLLATGHPHLARHRDLARDEEHRAFPVRAFRRIVVNFLLCDTPPSP
jgi:hypothetical protein